MEDLDSYFVTSKGIIFLGEIRRISSIMLTEFV